MNRDKDRDRQTQTDTDTDRQTDRHTHKDREHGSIKNRSNTCGMSVPPFLSSKIS